MVPPEGMVVDNENQSSDQEVTSAR